MFHYGDCSGSHAGKMGKNSISQMSKLNVSAGNLCQNCLNPYNIYCMPIEIFFFLIYSFLGEFRWDVWVIMWLSLRKRMDSMFDINMERFLNVYFKFFSGQNDRSINSINFKRDMLKKTYCQLVKILELYPNDTPQNIMCNLPYKPYYRLENFDIIVYILDCKASHYSEKLKIELFREEDKEQFRCNIAEFERLKESILKNKSKYFEAKAAYEEFTKINRAKIRLYSSIDVQNRLCEFEVAVHNLFISGYYIDENDYYSMSFVKSRLIDSMRSDLDCG